MSAARARTQDRLWVGPGPDAIPPCGGPAWPRRRDRCPYDLARVGMADFAKARPGFATRPPRHPGMGAERIPRNSAPPLRESTSMRPLRSLQAPAAWRASKVRLRPVHTRWNRRTVEYLGNAPSRSGIALLQHRDSDPAPDAGTASKSTGHRKERIVCS